MPRKEENPTRRLLAEAQALEVLLSDIVPIAEDVEAYWSISAEMLILVERIESLAASTIPLHREDPLVIQARVDLNGIASRILGLSDRAESAGI